MDQSGLDDHPDRRINPVLIYQIKLERERQREEKRRAEKLALIGDVDGLSAAEIEERLAATEFDTTAGTAQKQNALATLISVGARVTSVQSKDSAESAMIAELRRVQRNIDVYLQKALEVEVKRTVPVKRKDKQGGALKSAFEVAKSTASAPIGGEKVARETRNLLVAKSSRDILRQWEVRRRATMPAELLALQDQDSDDDGQKKPEKETVHRRGGGVLNAADFADMAALLDYDSDEEVGEDGEDGAAPAAANDDLAV